MSLQITNAQSRKQVTGRIVNAAVEGRFLNNQIDAKTATVVFELDSAKGLKFAFPHSDRTKKELLVKAQKEKRPVVVSYTAGEGNQRVITMTLQR
jgi:hypothetical protein